MGGSAGQHPDYDSSFDFEALDRFTRELTGESEPTAEQKNADKAQKDALFDAIMAEELSRIAGEKMPGQPQQPHNAQQQRKPQSQAEAAQSNEPTENGMAKKKKKKKVGMTIFMWSALWYWCLPLPLRACLCWTAAPLWITSMLQVFM